MVSWSALPQRSGPGPSASPTTTAAGTGPPRSARRPPPGRGLRPGRPPRGGTGRRTARPRPATPASPAPPARPAWSPARSFARLLEDLFQHRPLARRELALLDQPHQQLLARATEDA